MGITLAKISFFSKHVNYSDYNPKVAKERRMVEENECNWYFRKRFTFTSVNISYRGAIMNLNICSIFAVAEVTDQSLHECH